MKFARYNLLLPFLAAVALGQQNLNRIDISLWAPTAEFIVADSLGRRTGYNPLADSSFEEIPRAGYGDEGMDSEDPRIPAVNASVFELDPAFAGDFTLTIIGQDTTSEDFTLRVHLMRGDRDDLSVLNGSVSRTRRVLYRIHFDPDSTRSVSVIPLTEARR